MEDISKKLEDLLLLLRSRHGKEENLRIDSIPTSPQIPESRDVNRPEPKPIYEIKAEIEIPKASSMSKRRYKLRQRISCEEIDERRLKGLCVFCDEPETPNHYLQHKNSGILMIDCDEDQTLNDEKLVEIEVASESKGIEHRTVSNEAKANEILAILEEKSVPQFQVPIANYEILKSIEPGEVDLGLENLEYVVMNKNLEKEWVQKNVNKIFEVEDDEMFTVAKAVSMRFLLGIVLGITENYAGQGQQAAFEQILLVNEWLQTSLVTQQVMRSKKIKFPKRWMFKYKYVEEDIKSLHNQLSYMSRLELEERFKSWSQRETVEAKQNLKNWYDDSLLEFLKRIEAGSSMIMILYNNTELINYLYHLEKSCLVSIIRIENALIEARFVKTMEEYSKNHLASTLAYELFHSPRPPELFVADRMIATKEETEEVMKESDQKQQGEWSHYFLLVAAANWSPQMNLWSTSYHVWHRWKARYCFVGIISTMWAWLFGEEGFDIVKRSDELNDTWTGQIRSWDQRLRSFGAQNSKEDAINGSKNRFRDSFMKFVI